jgi:hypothetical protein
MSEKFSKLGDAVTTPLYLTKVPNVPIPGKVVQHNFPPRKYQKLAEDGFRAFWVEPDATKKVCDCGWAPHLGIHYTSWPAA